MGTPHKENKMQSKNYFCNDEIDRESCRLEVDEVGDKYYIGKHKVPSLKSIVQSLTGEAMSYSKHKNEVIESLHFFLLTGTKGSYLMEQDIVNWDTQEAYLSALKHYLDDEGFYNRSTLKITKNLFAYNKRFEPSQDDDPFEKCIERLEKELNNNLEVAGHYEEIANIEEYFTKEALNYADNQIENGVDLDVGLDDVAWYATFEKVGVYHYHLSKKRTKREDLYFVSKIDLATDDTLYYIATEANVSFLSVACYLNIQNIDLKKRNLKLLVSLSNGHLQAYNIPRFSDEQLDEIITAYKNKEQGLYYKDMPSILENIEIYERKPNTQRLFNTIDYMCRLFSNQDKSDLIGFVIFNLFCSFFVLEEGLSLKNLKIKIVQIFLLVLKNIKKACEKYSVELAYSYFQEAKHTLKIKEQSILTNGIENIIEMLDLERCVKNILKNTQKIGTSYKAIESDYIAKDIYEMKYQTLTLDLKVSEEQKRALMQFLDNNLIGCNFSNSQKIKIEDDKVLKKLDFNPLDFIETNTQNEGAENGSLEKANIENAKQKEVSQIISIKENKKLKTLKGDVIALPHLYQKNTGYCGCVENDEFIYCKIKDVHFMYSKTKSELDELIPHMIVVNVIATRAEKEIEFFIYLPIYAPQEEKLKKLQSSIREEALKIMTEKIEAANAELTLFFDTFSIKRGNFNFYSWIGKFGRVAVVKEGDIWQGLFKREQGKGVLFIDEKDIG